MAIGGRKSEANGSENTTSATYKLNKNRVGGHKNGNKGIEIRDVV